MECTGFAVSQLGGERLQHTQVVTAFELLRSDDGVALDFIERVFQLVGAIRRINTDHNCANLGGGQLHHHPLSAVWPPYTDSVSGLNTQRQQSRREAIHPLL